VVAVQELSEVIMNRFAGFIASLSVVACVTCSISASNTLCYRQQVYDYDWGTGGAGQQCRTNCSFPFGVCASITCGSGTTSCSTSVIVTQCSVGTIVWENGVKICQPTGERLWFERNYPNLGGEDCTINCQPGGGEW
jgi:hypothetical protein